MAYTANCSTCDVLSKLVKPSASSFSRTLSSSFLRLNPDLKNRIRRIQSLKIEVPITTSMAVAKDGVAEMAREKQSEKCGALRVGLVCGGPSAERGISLNSARSVLDHIQVRRGECRIGSEFSALRLICDRE